MSNPQPTTDRRPSQVEVARAIDALGLVELNRAVRGGERDHRGRLRWLRPDGLRP